MATKSGFQVSTFPPYLSSPVWPTAPIAPAPKFVVMPQNVKFVPEYNWGRPEDMPDPNCACQHGLDGDDDVYDDEALFRAELGAYGATEAQKRRARRKSARLRARAKKKGGEKRKKLLAKAIAVEKKAGIYKKPKAIKPKATAGSKTAPGKKTGVDAAVQEEAEAEALVDSGKVTEPDEADTQGVPKDAEEGRSNMTLIIGGTLALMAAIGIGFTVTQSRKRSKVQAAAPALPAPAPVAAEGADTEAVPSVSNPFRPSLRLMSVRRR